jgi:hypothetical protein
MRGFIQRLVEIAGFRINKKRRPELPIFFLFSCRLSIKKYRYFYQQTFESIGHKLNGTAVILHSPIFLFVTDNIGGNIDRHNLLHYYRT